MNSIRWFLVAALLCFGASSEGAIPRIVVHLVPSSPSSPHCALAPLPPCNEGESHLTVTGSVGTHYHLYILAADQPASYPGTGQAGISGAVFGIAYNSAPFAGVDVQSWTTCGDLAFGSDTPPWPASGSGMVVTWDRLNNCQDAVAAGDLDGGVTAVLAVLDIDVYSSDIFSITRRESSSLKDFQIADCSAAATNLEYPASAGKAAFGVDGGLDPCRGPFDPFSTFASLSPQDREKVVVKLTPLEDSPKSVLFLGPQAVADTTAFKDFQRPGFSYLSDVKNANQPLRLFNLSSGGISALMDSIATLPEVTDGNIDLDAKLSLSMFRRNDSGATRGFEAMVSLETGTQLLSKMVVAANEAGATLVIRDLACVLGMTSPLEPNDVTSQVRVRTRPMHLDQVHGRFTTTVQVDNISATSIPGPVSIILNEGPRVVLQNPSGYTCRLGSPGPTYIDLDIGTALDPGETATLTVTIAENDSPKLQLSPRVVCGPGPR
jgi:hypothetical protein